MGRTAILSMKDAVKEIVPRITGDETLKNISPTSVGGVPDVLREISSIFWNGAG